MKNLKNAIIIFLIFIINCFCVKAEEAAKHQIIRVIDGDTFCINFNTENQKSKGRRVRVNGIDTFETSRNKSLFRQADKFEITPEQALKLGYLGKKFAEKELLNKDLLIEHSAKSKLDYYGRDLVSIYYDPNRRFEYKSYEEEALKSGYAFIYQSSNHRKQLKPFEDKEKIKRNANKVKKLDIVALNKKTGDYHKLGCDNAWSFRERELIKKPHLNIKKHPASCCYDTKSYQRTKRKNCFNRKIAIPNAQESNIQLFFLNPLNQKKPVNRCATDACKALVYNINNAQESIDFAIYGIREQDAVFRALVKAQKRGVNVRWVTDLTEKGINIYPDTYKLMKKIPTYKTDFESQKNEKKKTKYFKYPQTAIMHDKFFIFDDKAVFTGSTNISNTCLTGFNSNVAVLINDKRIAKVYKQEFEQMYAGKFHNQKSAVLNNENIKIGKMNVSVYFSPINKTMTTQVIPLIQEAKEYIYVPAFYLTRRDVIEELIKAKNRGVDVRIIVDETSVKGRYVNINYIKKRGIDLKIERWQGKMHMKSIIIDDATLVIGSMNFTKQGEYINDENCLIIRNAPILTSAYKAHFLELWNSIK